MRRKMKKMRMRSQVTVKKLASPSCCLVIVTVCPHCPDSNHLLSNPPHVPFLSHLFSSSSASSSLLFIISTVSMCITVIILVLCVFACAGCLCLPLLAAGDYCPWDRELRSGLWLEKYLTDEDDVGTFKGSGRSACWCVCSNFERDLQSWLPRKKKSSLAFFYFFCFLFTDFPDLIFFTCCLLPVCVVWLESTNLINGREGYFPSRCCNNSYY